MSFTLTWDEVRSAGCVYDRNAICRGCGKEIEWWITPAGIRMPMDVMKRGADKATPHWLTCLKSATVKEERLILRPAYQIRFRDLDQMEKFKTQAKRAGLSLNEWMLKKLEVSDKVTPLGKVAPK